MLVRKNLYKSKDNVLVVNLLTVAMVMIVPQAIANPLQVYCFTQSGIRQELSHTSKNNSLEDSPPSVTLEVNGKSFQIIASHIDTIQLLNQENTTVLNEVRAPQYDYGSIKALTLLENSKWLWIDGAQADYISAIDLNQMPPKISKPRILSELYSHPCAIWERFIVGCSLAQGTYSPTLDRVFITGHRPKFWREPALATMEVVRGKPQLLPTPAQDAHLELEVPKLGGVLLRSPDTEAFFYDGTTVTPLLENPETLRGWHVETLKDPERTFITGEPPFLMELELGPKLKPISLPEEISENPRELFTLPNDSRLWGITRHRVFAEVEESLRTVVVAPASN